MSPQTEIMLIAVLVAVSCALPGTFLVLKGNAMMTDAITHTILLGIVLAFFITHDLTSPLLIIGATIVGLVTVFLTETLERSKLLSGDSATGIVFPLLFSIAIILITRFTGNVHLDTDAVLLGELAFAPFDRLVIFGTDIGAKSIYISLIVLILNAIFIAIFFKELKLATFDSQLAASLGFMPLLLHYAIMGMTSLTAVSAFNVVGSVLVIALMIGPPVTAYLITNDLKKMLIISSVIGAFNAVIGYKFAKILDVSIAGTIAVTTGVVFALVFIFTPKKGLISNIIKRRTQKLDFSGQSLMFHIYNHEGKPEQLAETNIKTLKNHMNWEQSFLDKIINRLRSSGNIKLDSNIVTLTEKGRETCEHNYEMIFA